jgi:hypothetical protein
MGDTTASGPGVRLRPRRNVRLVAAGVLAICLGGLGAAVLYTSVAGTESVVAVRRTVYRDQPLTAADLGLVELSSSPGIETVAAERLDDVVGQTALVDLVEGALLTPRGFGEAAVDAGAARLGVRVVAGRLPVGELPPGTPVLLVAVTRDAGAPPGQASYPGRVASLVTGLPDGASLLDVTVAAGAAEEVARLAATDQLVIVRQPGSSR